jgi:galactokinase
MNDLKPISEIQEAVLDNSLDAALARLYRRQDMELGPYRERILKLLERYSEIFDASPEDKAAVFSAPGRTELGGNHTDHQGGKVLTAAVDLDALCCAAPNGTDAVNIYSEGFGMTSISAKDTAVHEEEKGTSAAIVRGVLDGLAS